MMIDTSMVRDCKHTSRFNASMLPGVVVSMLSMDGNYDLSTRGGRVEFALAASQHTPSTAAKKIGCAPQAIYQWISNPATNIRNHLLFAFADLTGFEARWIATGEGRQRSGGTEGGVYVVDPRVSAIATTLLRAMEEGQEYLVENTQKSLDAGLELAAKAEARGKAKDC